MILLLAFGFGLGVLVTALASEYERKRRACCIAEVFGGLTTAWRDYGAALKAERPIVVHLGDRFGK